jgi:hypothetical protein
MQHLCQAREQQRDDLSVRGQEIIRALTSARVSARQTPTRRFNAAV